MMSLYSTNLGVALQMSAPSVDGKHAISAPASLSSMVDVVTKPVEVAATPVDENVQKAIEAIAKLTRPQVWQVVQSVCVPGLTMKPQNGDIVDTSFHYEQNAVFLPPDDEKPEAAPKALTKGQSYSFVGKVDRLGSQRCIVDIIKGPYRKYRFIAVPEDLTLVQPANNNSTV